MRTHHTIAVAGLLLAALAIAPWAARWAQGADEYPLYRHLAQLHGARVLTADAAADRADTDCDRGTALARAERIGTVSPQQQAVVMAWCPDLLGPLELAAYGMPQP